MLRSCNFLEGEKRDLVDVAVFIVCFPSSKNHGVTRFVKDSVN